ncbi:MAG: hypothetical protein ACOX1A_09045 [Saccharofermentanales bacterium]|jgi:hypothetical protein|nr:hypothetical protein [Clostridiaceae bacterium]
MASIAGFLFFTVLIGLCIYQLLPTLSAWLGRFHVQDLWNRHKEKPLSGQRSWLPKKWNDQFERRLRLAGIEADKYRIRVLCFLPVFILILAVVGDWLQRLMVIVLFCCLVNSWMNKRIRIRRQAYTKALYKIYRFLDFQLTAGIKTVDAFRGLPDAVHDSIVRPILVRFAARFELTLNLDQAMEEIHRFFPGTDTNLLATHLRQCLDTGQAGRSLLRMEELLFVRCFSIMQNETGKIRTQLLFTALLGICPLIILYLYPLAVQTLNALQSVFG